jgi:hypothetical protein
VCWCRGQHREGNWVAVDSWRLPPCCLEPMTCSHLVQSCKCDMEHRCRTLDSKCSLELVIPVYGPSSRPFPLYYHSCLFAFIYLFIPLPVLLPSLVKKHGMGGFFVHFCLFSSLADNTRRQGRTCGNGRASCVDKVVVAFDGGGRGGIRVA